MLQEEERRAAPAPESAAWLEHLPTYFVEDRAELGSPAAMGAAEPPSASPTVPVLIEDMPTQPLPPAARPRQPGDEEVGPYEGMVWVRPPQRHRRALAPATQPRESRRRELQPQETQPYATGPRENARRENARREAWLAQAATAPTRPRAELSARPREQSRSRWASDAPSPAPAPDLTPQTLPQTLPRTVPGPVPQPSRYPSRYPPAEQPAARVSSQPMRSSTPLVAMPEAVSPESHASNGRAPVSRAPVSRAPGRVRLGVPEGATATKHAPPRPSALAGPATVPFVPTPTTTPLVMPTRPLKREESARAKVAKVAKVASRPGRVRALLVTLAILLLVNLALQLNRRSLDVASDQYAALSRVERCESLGTVPDVLFLGSSRVVHGADAQLVDQVVQQQDGLRVTGCNVGDFGSTFELDYYILKRFIEDGYTPKLVVENVWEMNLNANARGGVTLPADLDSQHFGEVQSVADLSDLPSLAPRFGQFGGWDEAIQFAATKAIPLYGDRIALYHGVCGALQSLLRSTQPVGPCGENTSQLGSGLTDWYAKADRHGWVAQTDPPLGTMTPAQIAARSSAEASYVQQYLRDFKIGGLQPEYLRKLIALAKAHGVKVTLVTSPLDPMYFTYMSASTWNEIIAYWQSVARATGVPYFDESHAPGYTNMDFVDPQHPSIQGAHRFSTWMAEAIVGPALRCQAPSCNWR